jgi:hypothetical protein
MEENKDLGSGINIPDPQHCLISNCNQGPINPDEKGPLSSFILFKIVDFAMNFYPILFYLAEGVSAAASSEPSLSPSDPWKSVPNPWADPAHQYEGSGWVSPRKIIFFHFVKARRFSLNN